MNIDFKRGWLSRSAKETDKIMLYRFFSYNSNSLGPLICGGLYFSSPKDFNDSFDCDFRMMPTAIEKQLGISWDDAVEESKADVRKIGIACFTPHWNNSLMWAHYADKFRGFCLGFEFDNPLSRNSNLDDIFKTYRGRPYHTLEYWLHEMIYANHDEYPTMASFSFDETEEEMPEAILRYKAFDWQYEHEVRLSFLGGEGVHPIPGNFKEVYFGLRMDDEKKRVLISILGKHNPMFYNTNKSKTHIKIDRTLFEI